MDAPQHARMSTEELFRHHAPFVERFLLRLGVNESSVDDVVQEVFLVAHRSGGYTPGPAKPTTYLATIAVHAASAHRRAQKSGAARCGSRDIDELAAKEHDPAQQLEARDSLRQLESALDRLDDNLRTTLLMADGIGQTCPVIASAMDVPLGTVYWRLDRARKQFRAAWTTVSASKGTHRNGNADGASKHTSRGRRASALVLWWEGMWTRNETSEVLRASCQPPAAELALARTRAFRLPSPGTPLPSWASTRATRAPVSSVLGVATVKLAGLSVVGAVAIAIYAVCGAMSTSPTADPRVLAAVASTTLAASSTVRWSVAARPARSDGLPTSSPASLVGPPKSASAPDPVAVAETSTLSPSHAVQREPETTARAPKALPLGTTPTAGIAAPLIEAREVARAERMLASDPRGALRLLHTLTSSAGSQTLREERDYIEVIALFRIGQLRDARAASTRFLKSYPESAFAGAIVSTARRMTTDS